MCAPPYQEMLDERLRQMALIGNEELTNLMQLCHKLQKTAKRKLDEEFSVIRDQVEQVQAEVEEVQNSFLGTYG